MAEERGTGVEALHRLLEAAAPDVLREILSAAVTQWMSLEVEGRCGAGYGERLPERGNARNGYRPRPWDPRLGTIDLPIPTLRQGPDCPGGQLAIADAHPGLRQARGAPWPGAAWQRGRTPAMRPLLTTGPQRQPSLVAPLVRTLLAQPAAALTRAPQARGVAQRAARWPDAARLLSDAVEALLAFPGLPPGTLAATLVDQSAGAAQPPTQTPHRRRRHLPEPRRDRTARRGRPRRAARRVGRRPSLYDRRGAAAAHANAASRAGNAGGDGDARRIVLT